MGIGNYTKIIFKGLKIDFRVSKNRNKLTKIKWKKIVFLKKR